MDLLEKVTATIREHSMITPGDMVLVGLSGGPDSVCLSVILDELRDKFNLSLHALYVDHGLRPGESRDEAAFCKRFCDEHAIHFHAESVSAKEYAEGKRLNLQEASRELRYGALAKKASEIDAVKIAVAHNADDQAETVLMRLIRGSGRRGLSGISPVRGNIIRPLIDSERKEIEAFLSERSISFITDSSNLRRGYFRNRLRLELMPLLKEENPSLVEGMIRTAGILRDEERFLERETTKTLMRLVTRKTGQSIELFLVPLMNIDKAILRRVLRRAMSEISVDRGVESIHIDDIIRLVNAGNNGDVIVLPKGMRAVRSYSTLLITGEITRGLQTHTVEVPGKISLENGLSMISQIVDKKVEYDGITVAAFDHDIFRYPIQVRKRMAGDFFYPAGFGRRKKLQDFFVDVKVPREKRDSVPVVVCGEDIIWVAGYRMDERFVPSDKTKKFLILKISSS